MRRELAIAALSAFLAVPMWGQMRVAPRMSAPVGRGGFAAQNSWAFRGGVRFRPNPGFHVFVNTNPFFFPRPRVRFFPRPIYWPVAYGGYSYPIVVQSAPPATYYSSDYYRSDPDRRDLAQAVDRLSGEVAELRAAQARPQPQQEVAPAPVTVLVFKDNHIQEVKNYAVVGQTLWVFSERASKKIPLSDLDVVRTSRLNEERGVDFQLPK